MKKILKFTQIVQRLPADERRAIRKALEEVDTMEAREARNFAEKHIIGIAIAIERTNRRRTSDRRTDRERRVLVGARVPRERHEAYTRAAKASGRSLYRFVLDALEREYDITAASFQNVMKGYQAAQGSR